MSEGVQLIDIKEVAYTFGKSIESIRKYKNFGIIRVTDKRGNKDLFDRDQVLKVRDRLRSLRLQGLSLSQIADQLADLQEQLPTTSVEPPSAPAPSARPDPNKPLKILVVDDNTVNQKIAGLHVTKAGYEFDLATNGQEAVEMFAKNQYALILMDCMMPVMDGFEATKRIRQLEKEVHRGYRIPIIALTASVVDDDIQTCFDVGMDDYVPKPFKAAVLKDKLSKAVEASKSNVAITPAVSSTISSRINTQSKEMPEEQMTTPLPSRSERILLVEDNTVNQKVASLLLSKAGYQFEIAENGQIALDMFQQDNSFDIILMDCMMPVMDGFEATKEIRAYEKVSGLPKTPIIALTASVVDDDIQRCYDSGMDAYVPKPVRKEKLLHQIESVI